MGGYLGLHNASSPCQEADSAVLKMFVAWLQADSVTLEEAVWRHPVSCWRLEPMKWENRRHQRRIKGEKVGSEEVRPQESSIHWCYVSRVLNNVV